MNTKIKFHLSLLLGAFVCFTASCGPKDTGNNPTEESTELETIKTETTKIDEAIEEEVAQTNSPESESTLKVFSEEPIKGPGQWNPSTKMYTDDPRHLFWDLSFYDNWNTFDGVKLPKPVQLVVENADNGILAVLAAYPLEDKSITSIYKIPKDVVYNEVMVVQNKLFKLSENQEPAITKVTFRDKSAYEISFKANVPDQRSGERVYREYSIRMVLMVSDHEMIELMVMAPPAGLKRFGNDIFNMLLGKFNFVE